MSRSSAESRFRRRAVPPLVFALGLTALGCGIDEYEKKTKGEYDRLQRLDREAKYLGEPLRMPPPPKKEPDKEPWNVFLRAPLGVSVGPKAMSPRDLLAVYPGGGSSGFLEVLLGVSGDRKGFRDDVLRQFAPAGETKSESVVLDPERKASATQYTFDDNKLPSTVSVNFHPTAADPQVVVVYRLERGKLGGEAAEAIKMSLSTLGLDAEANRQRGKYNALQGKGKK